MQPPSERSPSACRGFFCAYTRGTTPAQQTGPGTVLPRRSLRPMPVYVASVWAFKLRSFLLLLTKIKWVNSVLKMELHGVNLDMMTNQPVVILRDPTAKRFLPIWIGQFEATAILMEMQGVKPSRPLTHDLLKSIIEQLKATIQHVVIDDLKDGTFFAKIHLDFDSSSMTIDARPSDAIALAVRMKAPIFAEEVVLEKASILTEEGEDDEVERFRDFLNQVNPDDFSGDAGPQG